MIKLKIEAIDGADLHRQLVDLLGGPSVTVTPTPVNLPPAAEEAEKPATTRAPRKPKVEKELEGNASAASAASSETETTSALDSAEDASSGSATDASPSDEVTIEDIRELTLKVVDKCGKPGIEAVLEQFGVARATQVPEDRRPELRDALQDALDAAVAA